MTKTTGPVFLTSLTNTTKSLILTTLTTNSKHVIFPTSTTNSVIFITQLETVIFTTLNISFKWELCLWRDDVTFTCIFFIIQVLPPLTKEVLSLPQQGDTRRNRLLWTWLTSARNLVLNTLSSFFRLVKLFTNPNTQLATLAADFCFVLCKGSGRSTLKSHCERYSSASQLFFQSTDLSSTQVMATLQVFWRSEVWWEADRRANIRATQIQILKNTQIWLRGKAILYTVVFILETAWQYLYALRQRNVRISLYKYFSVFEFSVNPVTGRWEEEKPEEEMSEERKEFEAMQLVQQLHKITKSVNFTLLLSRKTNVTPDKILLIIIGEVSCNQWWSERTESQK